MDRNVIVGGPLMNENLLAGPDTLISAERILLGSTLVFLAATLDSNFRAFDVETGEVLWKVSLPAGGQAVPMTYLVDGRQVVVIAAGGYGRVPIPGNLGDSLVAFALPAD